MENELTMIREINLYFYLGHAWSYSVITYHVEMFFKSLTKIGTKSFFKKPLYKACRYDLLVSTRYSHSYFGNNVLILH